MGVMFDVPGGQLVQSAIIGVAAHAPEPGAAYVDQARAELVAQKVKYPEDRAGVGPSVSPSVSPGVGHNLCRLRLGLLLKHDRVQGQPVAQGAGHGDAVEPGELDRNQVVERHPTLHAVAVQAGPK